MAQKYFTCKTDKAPYAYRCGEKIVFHIFYRDGGKSASAAAFKWEIAADFGYREEGKADRSCRRADADGVS